MRHTLIPTFNFARDRILLIPTIRARVMKEDVTKRLQKGRNAERKRLTSKEKDVKIGSRRWRQREIKKRTGKKRWRFGGEGCCYNLYGRKEKVDSN